MKIEVTQDDILEGKIGKSCYCPIALAMKRAYGHDKIVVSRSVCEIDYVEFATPKEAGRFIVRFDNGFHVSPFSFDFNSIPLMFLKKLPEGIVFDG